MKETTLHMFSGGRDSTLAAAIMAEKGYNVELVTYNNGCICGIHNLRHTVEALRDKYSNIRCTSLDDHNIGMTINYLKQDVINMDLRNLAIDYPYLNMNQLNCLYCKVAMFIHSIAICKKNGIKTISDGTRQCQGFYVDMPAMYARVGDLCAKNGIELKMPIYKLDDDLVRKCMLSDRGLPTKTLEMQCCIGSKMDSNLTVDQMNNLSVFYDQHILNRARSYINMLTDTDNLSFG